ncbi:HAD family hydrolase [Streptosporangium sp. NPDC049248]|uniref:HAD family hydrolase n=1 Tax=Streptosporangium sp. NPDC049248 TaxID=3155651 RepID=UPI00343536E5
MFFAKVRDRFMLSEPVEVLWSRYRRRMPHLVHCRPEVLGGLARLRASGWRIAVVTNGTADNQLGNIQQTGLAEAVDAYALSDIEGVRKPKVGLVEIAAKRCGMSVVDGRWVIGRQIPPLSRRLCQWWTAVDVLDLATDQPGTPTRVRRELSEAVTIADSDAHRAWPGRSTVADRLRWSLPPDEGAGRVRPQEEFVRTREAEAEALGVG